MMKNKFQEKGQALVVIALAAVALFGFAALAIDGSMVFSDKRHAQNAADTAALAGALAYTRGDNDITIASKAIIRTTSNGYDDNGTSNEVTITTEPVPSGVGGCPGNALGKYIIVNIRSTVQTTFARVVGTKEIINRVFAKARGCGHVIAPLFYGNAIVSLNQTNNPCAFDTGNSASARWIITGGGVFSNNCAHSANANSVTLDAGECVTFTTVTGSTPQYYTCAQQSPAITLQEVLDIMPPNPCLSGGIGLPQGSGSTFSNGVYCITDMDALDKKNIVLTNATLYVTDLDFNLKFAGSGGFFGTATTSGDFANYYMVIAYKNPPCQGFTDNNAQVIEFRGNGSGGFTGTVLAPSACLDLRGNGASDSINSQIIGYNVSSNGTADIYINYEQDDNAQDPYEPTVSLWE